MEIGLVNNYDNRTSKVDLILASGELLTLPYSDGQNMTLEDDKCLPTLSGQHRQRRGYALKKPEEGDVIVVVKGGTEATKWSYLSHFIYLLSRRTGEPKNELQLVV